MREASTERSPVADLQVADLGRALGDRGEGGPVELGQLARARPGRRGRRDAARPRIQLHPAELEAADVHENARPHDPELQDRDERLTACERLRVRVGERLERLVERRRADVLGPRRESSAPPSRSVAAGSTHRVHDRLVPRAAAEVALAAHGGSSRRRGRARAREDRTRSGSSRACRTRTGGRGARRTRAGWDAARRPWAEALDRRHLERPPPGPRASCSSSPPVRRRERCTRRTGWCRSRRACPSAPGRREAHGRAASAARPRAIATRR